MLCATGKERSFITRVRVLFNFGLRTECASKLNAKETVAHKCNQWLMEGFKNLGPNNILRTSGANCCRHRYVVVVVWIFFSMPYNEIEKKRIKRNKTKTTLKKYTTRDHSPSCLRLDYFLCCVWVDFCSNMFRNVVMFLLLSFFLCNFLVLFLYLWLKQFCFRCCCCCCCFCHCIFVYCVFSPFPSRERRQTNHF